MKEIVLAMTAAAGLAASSGAIAAPTLVPLSSFGVNGWRAPGVVQTGDSAGAVSGTSYLALRPSGDTERGLAYNPATGDLILVTRNGAITATGSPIRILDSATGRDKGELSLGTGIVSGGTFAYNQVAVSDDGQIFVSNLTIDARTSAFKVYSWANQSAAAPTVHYNGTQAWSTGTGTLAPRLGDSLDAIGSGSGITIAAGYRNVNGLFTLTGSSSPTGQIYTNATAPTVPPAGSLGMTGTSGPTAPDFRLGLTFGATSSDVLGKVTSAQLRTAVLSAGGLSAVAGNLTAGGEGQIDFAMIGGVPYMAALDVNNSRLYVYDISDPSSPLSLFPFGLATQTGTVAGNGNASGAVKFGAIDQINQTANIYTLNTNNGIQAFTFTVPAPGTAALLGLGGLLAARRRR